MIRFNAQEVVNGYVVYFGQYENLGYGPRNEETFVFESTDDMCKRLPAIIGARMKTEHDKKPSTS